MRKRLLARHRYHSDGMSWSATTWRGRAYARNTLIAACQMTLLLAIQGSNIRRLLIRDRL
jgi:hypothetical protein